ncbi:MAG TPA: DUF924 family protein [Devosia sp.]|nr:DUF924 family protein [Devosia sp.]
MTTLGPEDVHGFWFIEHGPADWFAGGAAFDAEIAERFGTTHAEVARGEAWEWRKTPLGRVAEIIVLDQFSRQLFRGQARAFAQDSMALALAQEAVALGVDRQLTHPPQRQFLYMPYMHSESLVVHEEAVRLFTEMDNADVLKFEMAHLEVLQRFGRYPKRNEALGRTSTPEEIEYMATPGMF